MKIRIRKHFPVTDVLFTIALICITSYAFLENITISIMALSAYKLPILYVGALCILSQINLQIQNFTKKKYFFVWMWVLFLCAALLVSLKVNKNPANGEVLVRTTTRLILYLLELFALMVWCAEEGRGRYVIKFVCYYLLILAIATDFLLITGAIIFENDNHVSYLVGTKFSVSYLHMNLLTFWTMKSELEGERKRRRINVILAIALVGISVLVNCVTGVLGALAMLYFLYRSDAKRRVRFLQFSSPGILILVLLASAIFPVAAGQIVSIPVVSHFVTSVLGKSATLTGRLNIFEMFGEKMEPFWVWGGGIGNGFSIAPQLFGYANAQNAILQWLLEGGIIITVLLCGLIVCVFWQLSKSERKEQLLPLIILIYVYVIMGAVEITFNMSFLMLLSIMFMLINERENLPITENG